MASDETMRLPRSICFFFALAAAVAQPAGTGSIGGIVIDTQSGDPVKKAIVTLTWHGQPKSWATARTSADGRFRFDGLPAGNFDLRAQKQGVGTAVYGADRIGETPTLIPLDAGQSRADLKLRFVHSSSISGHVLDSEGDPIAMANVVLYRVGRNLGEPILVRASGNQANDRGEYKLNNVQPGRYYLSAVPQGSNFTAFTALAPAFYGDRADWKNSTQLAIHDGEELTGFDFHLVPEQTVPLNGHIRGVPEQPPPPGAAPRPGKVFIGGGSNVQVFINRIDTMEPFSMGIGATADGRFGGNGFNLIPGRYRFDAQTEVENRTYAASQVVDVQPGMGDIELTLAPAPDVKGHLHLEGGTAAQASQIEVAFSRTGQRSRNLLAHAAADGMFTLAQVMPGNWELNLNHMPRGAYIKSVMLGDKDVRFQRIAIESGSDAALNIVVSMNSAKISGETSPGAGILVVPAGKFHDFARFYYAVMAGDDGKFKINGITPGTYKIYALEKLASMRYRTPEAADALEALGQAQEIAIPEGADLTVEPKLIPFERAREVIP